MQEKTPSKTCMTHGRSKGGSSMAEHPKHPLQEQVTKQLCHVVRTVRCALPPGSAAEGQPMRRAPIAEGIDKGQTVRRAPIPEGINKGQPIRRAPIAEGITEGQTVRRAPIPEGITEGQTVRRAPIAEGITEGQTVRRAPIASGKAGERTAPQPMQQSPLAQGISPVYIDRRQYHFTIGNLEEFVKIQERMEMERQSLRMGYLPRIK